MAITTPRFLTGVIGVLFVLVETAGAEPDRKFEGPYHVAIQPLERVHATVKSTYRFPDLDARQLWAAYAWPPEFEGQTSARVQVRVAETPFAETNQIVDESGSHRPILVLHWFPDSNDTSHRFTTEAEYDVTITRRTLQPGAASTPVRRLSTAERSAFLTASSHFDFSSSRFQGWLRKQGLRRKPDERDLDFAYRAMATLVTTHTYRLEVSSRRSASAVCAAGWSDCGGLSTIYVSILRANGIPARCLTGRSIKPNTPHVKIDFYADGVGWVPGDPAVAIGSHHADAGFGHDHFDMLIAHFDVIKLEGKYHWLQGIPILQIINLDGSGGNISSEYAMEAEVLPLDSASSTASEAEQQGPPTKRSRKRR